MTQNTQHELVCSEGYKNNGALVIWWW